MLNQIAQDCVDRLKELDTHAQQAIALTRRKYGGTAPPQNAPERKQMEEIQRHRDAIVRNAVIQLRATFGEAEFKRLDDYLLSQGIGLLTMPPPADKKPLPVEVNLAFFDRQGETPRRQFSAQERFILQVMMRNNSTQTVSVTPANVFAWLQLYPQEPHKTNLLFKLRGDHVLADQPVTLPPNEVTIVARINLGMGDVVFTPGSYYFAVAQKAMVGHPPKESDWLTLSLSQAEGFVIVP